MFSEVKLICLAKKESCSESCLNVYDAYENSYLKLANLDFFKCPACGQKNNLVSPFFNNLLKLKKSIKTFNEKSNFKIGNFGFYNNLFYEEFFKFEFQNFQFANSEKSNNQIGNILLYYAEKPELIFEIWEDVFVNSLPFLNIHDKEITFKKLIGKDFFKFMAFEIKNLNYLKCVLNEAQSYNELLLQLSDSYLNVAPVYTYQNLKKPL